MTWCGLNKHHSGIVTGFYSDFAVVRVDGSGLSVLLQNKPINPNLNAPERTGRGASP